MLLFFESEAKTRDSRHWTYLAVALLTLGDNANCLEKRAAQLKDTKKDAGQLTKTSGPEAHVRKCQSKHMPINGQELPHEYGKLN